MARIEGEKICLPDGFKPSRSLLIKVLDFINRCKPFEINNGALLTLYFDEKSKSYYLQCHLEGELLSNMCDTDAVLDPDEDELYKLNRDIYTDSYAFKLMEKDALGKRSFEDIVVEYDKTYKQNLPLKVFGGQHRIAAIKSALEREISCIHGIRVYFSLNTAQRLEIATVNNTSIAVSSDLLDRMQETFIGSDLRDWCQKVGLLSDKQDFADKRNSDGRITIRVARTLIVNYVLGSRAKIEEEHTPYVVSTGPGIDETYGSIRREIDWDDQSLEEMGMAFSNLHNTQRKQVLGRDKNNFFEFANKSIHPTVVAAWAYASGLIKDNEEAQNKLYCLPENLKADEDPLNVKALSEARLKGIDPDTYRGLGARINANELGRMLELFLIVATKASKPGINKKLAEAAIKAFEAKKAISLADKALKGI